MSKRLTDREVFNDIHDRIADRVKILNDRDGCIKMPRAVRESVIESLCLHLREFVDILLDKGSDNDDVLLQNVFPNFHLDDNNVGAITTLREEYGTRKEEGTPCWIINKMIAHPTTKRFSEFDYTDSVIGKLIPLIADIVDRCRKSAQKSATLHNSIPNPNLCGKTIAAPSSIPNPNLCGKTTTDTQNHSNNWS